MAGLVDCGTELSCLQTKNNSLKCEVCAKQQTDGTSKRCKPCEIRIKNQNTVVTRSLAKKIQPLNNEGNDTCGSEARDCGCSCYEILSVLYEELRDLHAEVKNLKAENEELRDGIKQVRDHVTFVVQGVDRLSNSQGSHNSGKLSKGCDISYRKMVKDSYTVPVKNRYDALCGLEKQKSKNDITQVGREPENVQGYKVNRVKNVQKVKESMTQNTQRPKKQGNVLILGDSHARNTAVLLKDKLCSNYDVSCITKPGAVMSEILRDCDKLCENMTSEDTLIVIGGGNDVAKNEGKKAVLDLYKGLKSTVNTNVYVTGIPHRHDLSNNSCVNTAVECTNSKMAEICKPYLNVKFVDLNFLERSDFTRHGLHLNNTGKRSLCSELAKQIKSQFLGSHNVTCLSHTDFLG
jgi:hypothetical protein